MVNFVRAVWMSLIVGLGLTACGGGGGGGSLDSGFLRLESIIVSAPATTLTAGQTVEVSATGVYGDGSRRSLSVRWTTSDESVGKMFSDRLTVDKEGTVDVIATGTFDSAVSGRLTFTVKPSQPKGVRIVGFADGKSQYASTDLRQLTAQMNHPEGWKAPSSPVQWTSSNPEIAAVDANGLFRGIQPGAVSITAKVDGLQSTADITLVAPEPNPIVLSCLYGQNVISMSQWNNFYTKDPQNGSEWVKFDEASCSGRNNLVISWRDPVKVDDYYRLVAAERKNGRFLLTGVSNSLTVERADLAVGYMDRTVNDFFFTLLDEFKAVP